MRLATSVFLLATCSRGSELPLSSPTLDRLISHYAPRIHLGQYYRTIDETGYHFTLAPYAGWEDITYQGPDGIRGLRLVVNEHLADETSKPSGAATIQSVVLGLPTDSTVKLVGAYITRVLGNPRVYCRYKPNDARAQFSSWYTGRLRVLMIESRAEPPRPELAGASTVIIFGAQTSTEPEFINGGACH